MRTQSVPVEQLMLKSRVSNSRVVYFKATQVCHKCQCVMVEHVKEFNYGRHPNFLYACQHVRICQPKSEIIISSYIIHVMAYFKFRSMHNSVWISAKSALK